MADSPEPVARIVDVPLLSGTVRTHGVCTHPVLAPGLGQGPLLPGLTCGLQTDCACLFPTGSARAYRSSRPHWTARPLREYLWLMTPEALALELPLRLTTLNPSPAGSGR